MPPKSSSYQLDLLGGFNLRFDDHPVAVNDSSARLLAVLALASAGPRTVSRLAVADRLWPDDSTRSGARLRSALWRLPKTSGHPLFVGTTSSLRLADPVSVDVWQAERDARSLAADPRTDGGCTADISVFAADLLPDWSDDWLVIERESFRQTRLHALERASDRLRAAGRFEDALRAALTAVACEPLRETAHRRVIETHLAEGNHAEALRQYQIYRRLLAAELGLVPTPATRTLVAPLLGRPADHRPQVRTRREC